MSDIQATLREALEAVNERDALRAELADMRDRASSWISFCECVIGTLHRQPHKNNMTEELIQAAQMIITSFPPAEPAQEPEPEQEKYKKCHNPNFGWVTHSKKGYGKCNEEGCETGFGRVTHDTCSHGAAQEPEPAKVCHSPLGDKNYGCTEDYEEDCECAWEDCEYGALYGKQPAHFTDAQEQRVRDIVRDIVSEMIGEK